MSDPTGSYAPAGYALQVTETHKPPYHVKVTVAKGRTILTGFREVRADETSAFTTTFVSVDHHNVRLVLTFSNITCISEKIQQFACLSYIDR